MLLYSRTFVLERGLQENNLWEHRVVSIKFSWVLYCCLLIRSSLLPQIVGNLLYYRYMNPAIVAPDAFDIIDLSAGGQLTTDQRRNLGSIAKMLQHAASNKMFMGDNAHLSIINEYLLQSYQKFR